MLYFYLFFGCVLGYIGTITAIKVFPYLGWLDFPERYGLKRPRIPYPGGITIFLSAFVLAIIDIKFLILLFPLLLIGIVSFWDDLKQISSIFRLGLHISMAGVCWFLGIQIQYISSPISETNFNIFEIHPFFSFSLTVLWIVGIQNAMNWFDGIKGLAPGISGIGFLILGILGIIRPELFFDTQHTSLTIANLFLAGLSFGGFWYYLKGKIILGDTGSQTLGFLLAVMAIFSGAKIATTLLVLSLPILDFFWVIFRRTIIEKKSPFRGDQKHFPQILAQHIGEKRATMCCLIFSGLFGIAALFFDRIEKLILLIILSLGFLALSFRLKT